MRYERRGTGGGEGGYIKQMAIGSRKGVGVGCGCMQRAL